MPTATPNPAIFVERDWAGERGHEAARLCADGFVHAIIDWSLPPEDSDSPLPPGVGAVLCRTLLASGRLAFRLDAPPQVMSVGDRFIPEPGASALTSLKRFFLGLDVRFGVLMTSDPRSAAGLFDFAGWTNAEQAALVVDPGAGVTPEVMGPLQRSLEWRGSVLPAHVRALFGSGHDGAFSVLSCRDEARMSTMLADLKRFAGDAGLRVESGPYRAA